MKVKGKKLIKVDETDVKNGQFISPSNIKVIGKDCFSECDNIYEIVLTEGVEVLEDYAFSMATADKVFLPSTIDKIHPKAFKFCEYLNQVYTPEGIAEKVEGKWMATELFDKEENMLVEINEDEIDDGVYFVPSNILAIGQDCFKDCDVDVIILSEGVKSLEEYAFSNSTVKRIILPSTIENIHPNAFKDCVFLSEIYTPEGVLRRNKGVWYHG